MVSNNQIRRVHEKDLGVEGLKKRIVELIEDMKSQPWRQVVLVIKRVFSEGEIPKKLFWSHIVMIPKSNSTECSGIGLLGTLWKVISNIIKVMLNQGINWNKLIHGFRRDRGTTTSIIELKLAISLSQQLKTPLYNIFLDMKKAYDSVYIWNLIKILEEYEIGQKLRRVIWKYWNQQKSVIRKGKYCGKVFTPSRGVTQGDIISPIIFKILVDSVISRVEGHIGENEYIKLKSFKIFYADDGVISGM